MLKDFLPIVPGWPPLQLCEPLATHLTSPYPHPYLSAGPWSSPPLQLFWAVAGLWAGCCPHPHPRPAPLLGATWQSLPGKGKVLLSPWLLLVSSSLLQGSPSLTASWHWGFFTISSLHRTRCQVTFNSLKWSMLENGSEKDNRNKWWSWTSGWLVMLHFPLSHVMTLNKLYICSALLILKH